jgi:CDP-4-dehydro-6-deoxyglucose reductase
MNTTYNIRLEPGGGSFACRDDQSVLDAAAQAGYWLPHSCRAGSCGSCTMPVLAGSFEHLPQGADSALKELPAGSCLACQALPTSDLVLDAPNVPAEPGQRIVKVLARVTEVTRPSADVVVVRAQVPPAGGWAFQAGQYADLILRDGARRNYSMANAPNDRGEIEWHIRRIEGGRFSTHAYDALKPREMLRIEGPYGHFTLQEGDAPVLLLASGTGYAPIAALLRTHGAELARRRAVLYWGGRRRADLYAVADEAAWRAEHPGVGLVPVFSEVDAADAAETGRRGFVHEAVLQDWPDLSAHEVYACGNPAMVDAARAAFVQRAGLPATRFHSDAFIFKTPTEAT